MVISQTNALIFLEAIRTSLGVASPDDPIQMCVCSEQLSNPATYWDVTSESMTQLINWWQLRMACPDDNFPLTDDLYLDIVAR